jgi:hypothetical protein
VIDNTVTQAEYGVGSAGSNEKMICAPEFSS